MTNGSSLSRRQLLAAIGGVGLLAAAPRVAGALGREPSFTRYTYAQSVEGGPNLRVAWYERYNGALLEESNRFGGRAPLTNSSDSFNESAAAGAFVDVTGPDAVDAGPVLSIPNAHPGDEGLLVIGLRAEEADARAWLRVTASEFAENSLVEPEVSDGDAPTAGDPAVEGGELQDHVDVELWYDTGRLGVGGCNGLRDFSEEAVIGRGTLAAVDVALDGGVPLDFGVVEAACIPEGAQRCLALRWAIDPAVNNVIQSDSARLDIAVAVTACGDTTNPFEGSV
ncbi:hypothetical protein [Haloplanus halophilus]|uniref:hypothetical protein n=1 Tax=Haloplanus halophilus TaxID=2949993 RepID=UPI00203C2D3B|nr:hypothetical protein [Haloplanus sp. GDY1]